MNKKKRLFSLGNRGSLSYALLFFFLFVLLVLIFAIIIPTMQLINTQSFVLSDKIITDANRLVNDIQDANAKAAIQATFASQKSSIQTNIDILGLLATYSWAIISLLLLVTIFLAERQRVERGVM